MARLIERFAEPKIMTTVRISPEFYNLCKKHNIKFSEAIAVGIAMILAEKGVGEYDNNLNLFRKMKFYQQELEKVLERVGNK